MTQYNCRVCGLFYNEPPWGEDNKTPNYEICLCCGVEFGNEDYTVESVRNYRARWLNDGAKWFVNKAKPGNWNFECQMTQIPEGWL